MTRLPALLFRNEEKRLESRTCFLPFQRRIFLRVQLMDTSTKTERQGHLWPWRFYSCRSALRSSRFTEPPCQQEQQETAEMAAVGLPDSPVQVFYDPLQYGILEVAKERGRAPGGNPASDRTGILGSFHSLVLLSRQRSVLFD
jgi:hypothetical protein